MKIGLDVESGERSFEELINGAFKSLKSNPDIEIYIIGNIGRIKNGFPQIENNQKIKLINAKEIITMHERPIQAVKRKKDSSLVIGIKLLKEKVIDVFFSPGNTGATVAASVLNLGMIKGIKKPAMATFFPRIGGGETLILDIGANPDATDEYLFLCAVLGKAYYKLIWDKQKPSIGLLNMGVEFGKGSEIIRQAFNLMRDIPNFVGNVEGYNVFNGSVDIVVCNGFTGNSILKIAESMKKFFLSIFKDAFLENNMSSKFNTAISYVLSRIGIYTKKKRIIMGKILPKYFGAAPLLGVNGTVLIGHGNCNSFDIENTISLAKKLDELNFVEEIKDNIKKNIKKD